jgi:hypothetical protein
VGPINDQDRVELDDVSGFLRKYARVVAALCMLVVAAGIGVQVLATINVIEDPWLPLGAGFLSSAAMGIDAVVVGVRKRHGVGPSIVNLAPGGWALFGVMLWIVAIPAYLLVARRRARKAPDPEWDDWYEPVRWGSWAAILLVTALGLFTSLGGR